MPITPDRSVKPRYRNSMHTKEELKRIGMNIWIFKDSDKKLKKLTLDPRLRCSDNLADLGVTYPPRRVGTYWAFIPPVVVDWSYLRWPDLLASVYPGTYFPTWMAERLSWPISLRLYDDLISITSTWYWTRIARIVAQQFTHYATVACQYERCSIFLKKTKQT